MFHLYWCENSVSKLPAATTPVVNRSGPRFDPGGAEDSLGCAMAGSLLTKDANMVTLYGFLDTADPSSDVAAAATAVVAGAADDNLSAAVVACATAAVVAAADEFSAVVLSSASDFSARAAPAFMSSAAST